MQKLLLLLILVFVSIIPNNKSIVATNSPNVILITLDGVRWQEIFNGQTPDHQPIDSQKLLPNLYQNFVSNGIAFGNHSEVKVSGPAHISLPGYLEILRGHATLDCLNNDCGYNKEPTIVNLFNKSAVFSSWVTINHVVDKSPILNNGRNYRNLGFNKLNLPDNKDFPVAWGDKYYRPDFYTTEAVDIYLKNNHPEFLWISLGDTDENAHAGNYSGYLASLQFADQYIGNLLNTQYGKNSIVIVTTDHGRSLDWRNHHWDPESARTWILMRGPGIPAIGMVQLNQIVHPANIYPTIIELLIKIKQEKSLLNYNNIVF
jgi:hypothetical protein